MNHRKNKKQPKKNIPDIEELRSELKREQYIHKFNAVLKSTLFTLIIVAAISVLVATLWLPILQIYGSSMTDTLVDGDIVVTVKNSKFDQGDIISFYYNNKILVKRVIACEGDWVDIDEEGNVYVNNNLLDEPYINEKNRGDCNIELPYQVPDGKLFVMGDHRLTSVDSRNSTVGCVTKEQIVGKIIFCVWPLNRVGIIK